MTYEELVIGYGRDVGIDGIGANPGECVFVFDDFPIRMSHDDAFNRIVLMADVGTIAPEQHSTLCPRIVQLNLAMALNGGHILAANFEAEEIYCIHGLPISGLTPERLADEVQTMLLKSQAARDLLLVDTLAADIANEIRQSDGAEAVMIQA